MSPGTILPTTEITPRPPMASSGSVRLSSPLSTVRFVRARICEAWSSEPVASLTIAMLGNSAMRAIVSGSIFLPVRPGMLYTQIGRLDVLGQRLEVR